MEWNQQILKKIQLRGDHDGEGNIVPLLRNKMKNIMGNHADPDNKRTPEPLQLSGNFRENWKYFRRQFQNYLKTPDNENKNSQDKVDLLLNVLGEEGLDLYKSFDLDDTITANLDLVLARFDEYFKKKNNVVNERYVFQKRIQGNYETFDSFLNDIRNMIGSCSYADQEDNILRDRIVAGVNDPNLQLKLIDKEVGLEQAVQMCRLHYSTKVRKLEKKIESNEPEVLPNDNLYNAETKQPISSTEVHAISSESEAEDNTRMPKISFCVGSFHQTFDGTPEASGIESRSESPKSNLEFSDDKTESSDLKIQIADVHTLSNSDSEGSTIVHKKNPTISSDSDDNNSNEENSTSPSVELEEFNEINQSPIPIYNHPVDESGNILIPTISESDVEIEELTHQHSAGISNCVQQIAQTLNPQRVTLITVTALDDSMSNNKIDDPIQDQININQNKNSEVPFPKMDKGITSEYIAPKKYSRIKSMGSVLSKKNENGNKRKANSPPRKKKVKKNKQSDQIEDVNDWSDNVYDSDADSDSEVSNKMSLSQRKVFEFFNTASTNELLQVPTCTEKKTISIIESRPYENWKDLVYKMETRKHLTGNILNCALDVLKTRTIVSKLMEKCLKLAISTEKAITAGLTSVKEQPSILAPNLQLKSYQMVGLNWLIAMHHQNLSGILADEMGLGKTIQVIAFLSYLHENGEALHTHLIVVPATTLENWAVEFSKWAPSLRVVVYHGHPDDRRALRVQWFKEKFTTMDVILTTYNIITSNYEEKKMFRIISLDYVVFDEAHMLKNMNAQRYGHLFSINARKRILLTGTPLQNSLLELMSLLNFVMPDMFANRIQYIKTFFSKNNKVQGSDSILAFEQEQVDLAKQIMKPFVLRRLKDDVLSDLPTKTHEVMKCPLTKDQKEKYDEFTSNMRECAKNDRDNYNYMSSFMQLRRLSNHPLACRYIYQDDQLIEMAERLSFDMSYKENNKDHIFEDLAVMSDFEIHSLTDKYKCVGKFKLDDEHFLLSGKFKKLDEVLPELKNEGHRVLIFSQFVFMLDILEEYLRIRDHDYLRLDGSTNSLDRQDLIDNYNEDSNIFIFLLTTRAGGIGINLTTADRVIIHDIDFNPYNDKQAEDRCHRLGQTKPVHIIRLLSEGTVEEYIHARAQHKLNLEQELISNEESEESKNVEDLLKEVLGFTV